ncbi:MAG: hypothetical protein DUD39_18130 [Coriobacteriaceae bacterium]|nr:MAG: hypothetical protein DUD39_18130 [Coriobacteriaceae bacterium]
MNRILRCVLTLAHTVIEYVRIEGDRVVIRVRPALPDLQQEMRLLRQIARPSARRGAMGLVRSMCLSGIRAAQGKVAGVRRAGRVNALGEAQSALHA